MSTDAECLTVVGRPDERDATLRRLLGEVAGLAPCLPGPSGWFTGYGRVYVDAGHVELAAAECDSPYQVPAMLGRLQAVVAEVAGRLGERGEEVLLATCTHGGRLGPGAGTWGAHENYLVTTPPRGLVDRILPFLVTRAYAGSGAVWAATGEFLFGARLTALAADRGGSTTGERAIFSTARDEDLAGGRPGLHRCHLILGDGHRSEFSLALQLGATALALRAVEASPGRVGPLPRRPGWDQSRFWLAAAGRFNRLAAAGEPLAVDPLALDVQRFYLDLSADFVSRLDPAPPWTSRLLADWDEALRRLGAGDEPWAWARLDPWIKRRLFSAWLADRGASWESLRTRPDLVDGLALLDQSYHAFTAPPTLFDRLESSGLLAHRVGPPTFPGSEPEPFVPEVATRARARAGLIREQAGSPGWSVDWDKAVPPSGGRTLRLDDPFAAAYEPPC